MFLISFLEKGVDCWPNLLGKKCMGIQGYKELFCFNPVVLGPLSEHIHEEGWLPGKEKL